MLTVPAALNTAVQKDRTTLCRLVTITRQDGVALHLTDAVLNIVIGTGTSAVTYRADVGFTCSALLVGMNIEHIQGLSLSVSMADGGVKKEDLHKRRYYAALVELAVCDFTQPEDTYLTMFEGRFGKVEFLETGVATIEVLPKTSQLDQWADEIYSQTCRASLGDARCKFPIDDFKINFTVTEVLGPTLFVADTFGPTAAATPDDDYYAQGQMKWLTGDNAEWEVDILSSDFSDKTVQLFYPLPSDAQVGDTGQMFPGCDRQLSTCAARFANVLNFRGEPFAPQWSIA